jgi:hypothetical protein
MEGDPAVLVRRAVEKQAEADKTHHPLRYTLRKKDERHETAKEIVETRDGDVAMLVAEGGKPLGLEARQAELARLDTLAQHPELQQKRQQSEKKDAARVAHMLGLLPDALAYKLEGTVPCGVDECYRLTFTPKPGWSSPDIEGNILRGVAGEIWIDRRQERLVRLDATFIADVTYFFGILGHLDKDSTIRLEQSDVGNGDWELTRLTMNVTGKALLVKNLSFKVTEETYGFASVSPDIGYRDAIELLKDGR